MPSRAVGWWFTPGDHWGADSGDFEKLSPYLELPSFQTVADQPGITERALTVWLTNPHPNMPDFIIPQADMDNVIAYIISLQSASH